MIRRPRSSTFLPYPTLFGSDRARLADRFELADQRMSGIDLVIPVSPDQHQMLHVRLGQQILQQVQGCRVEPLQIVEEQRRSEEHTSELQSHLNLVCRLLLEK